MTTAVPTTLVPSPHRLRHPAAYTFLLGGFLGSGLNLVVTLALARLGTWPPLAIALGTLANEAFHHVYYHVVYVNQEIRLRTPLPLQVGMYVAVAAAAGGLLWAAAHVLPLVPAVVAVLTGLAVANAVINRISTFSSATLAMVEYRAMGEAFYDDQTDTEKVNAVRAWFHRSRFANLTKFVDSVYRPGMAVADLGCGDCLWNVHGYPVTGVDVNEPMMRFAQRHGRLADFRATDDLSRTGLPDASMDVVVMSETLEHLLNVEAVVAEVRRVLRPGGTFLITVPYDFFLGPFFVLFNVNCLWQGYVRGSAYHRYRCGHVNHFTKRRLRDVLAGGGFGLSSIKVVNGLTLYAAAVPVGGEILHHGDTEARR